MLWIVLFNFTCVYPWAIFVRQPPHGLLKKLLVMRLSSLMFLLQIAEQFLTGLQQTTLLEYIAVAAGIASVWFSKKENILVYPVGLINTVVYVYLSFKFHLLGEAAVNFYYTIMSIYGWVLWARRDRQQQPALHITFASSRGRALHGLFFVT